jgi:hypothetical protein
MALCIPKFPNHPDRVVVQVFWVHSSINILFLLNIAVIDRQPSRARITKVANLLTPAAKEA